ncbi:MAG: hypothetical protein LBD46_01140 [Endomicrobium sp.]|jgi:hypothetical protein|nr:hypothetical protein [Endomicrobium sp.]
MTWLHAFKNNFLGVFRILSDVIKNHFFAMLAIFIVYSILNFSIEKFLVKNFVHNGSFLYDIFVIIAELSFISITFSLFAGKKFFFKKLFPGIKFLIYSLLLTVVIFIFSIPLRILANILINTVFPPLLALLFTMFYASMISLTAMGILFSIFNFIEKPAIDQPILSMLDIFANNKLFVSTVSFITGILFIAIPILSQESYFFVSKMFFCVFFTALYFTLKSKENAEDTVMQKAIEAAQR